MPFGLGAAPPLNVPDEDGQAESPTVTTAQQRGDEEEEEDDYMNFILPDDHANGRPMETSLQRASRLKREAEARSRPKSKAEVSREEELRREQALLTRIDQSNRGWKIMEKQGFRPGDVLGPIQRDSAARDASDDASQSESPTGLREPLGVDTNQGREGIGMLNEKKRKFRDEIAAHIASEKRQREEVDDYRVRQAQEREERRAEGLLISAQRIAFQFDEDEPDQSQTAHSPDARVLRSINVLWRGYFKEQRERERQTLQRHDLNTSLSRRQVYAFDGDDEENTFQGTSNDHHAIVRIAEEDDDDEDDDEDDDDEELDAFEALTPAERLVRVTALLRSRWHYCLWCKTRYADADELKSHCPGPGEDNHE